MKRSSKRAFGGLLASVMLLTSIVGTTTIQAARNSNVTAYSESVTSGSSVESGSALDTSDLATPETGKTYSADFATLNPGDKSKVDGVKFGNDTIMVVSPKNEAYYHGSEHGLALKDGDRIKVAVAGNATIALTVCTYGKGVSYTAVDASGNKVGTVEATDTTDKTVKTISYTGDATTITITLSSPEGESYLHGISVENEAVVEGVAENFVQWFDDLAKDVDGVATVEPGEYKYGDAVLELVGNGTEKFVQLAAGANVDYGEKVANAYKAGSRNANANDIATIPKQGDGTALIFTPVATGTLTTYFFSTSFLRVWDFDANTGERYGYVDSEVSVPSYAFQAKAGHTYVMSTTGKTNNCAYAGVEYIVDEPFKAEVTSRKDDGNYDFSKVVVYLTDVGLGTKYAINPDTTSLDLAKNHTYSITTNDGGAGATINGSSTYKAEEGSSIGIEFVTIPDVTLTGTITGIDDVSAVKSIKFVSMVSGAEYPATITGNTYTATIKPGDFNTVAEAEGYETSDHVKVDGDTVNEIYFEAVDPNFYDLPVEISKDEGKSALKFNAPEGVRLSKNNDQSLNAGQGSSITVPVSGKQVVKVAGWYNGTMNINGKSEITFDKVRYPNARNLAYTSYVTDGTETSVDVNFTGSGTNYPYWIKVTDAVDYKSEITVPGDAATLTEANELIWSMDRPEGEAGRVTINLASDFQEQVVIDAPYVTINGNGHEINWYYGVGTKYYSVDSVSGLYDEALFHDKYSTAEADGNWWGGVVIVRGDNFKAEDVTFRNTYNYEVTEKEKEDGLFAISGMPDRFTSDVTAYAAKERSNAFYVEADNIELKNCKILSSQDSFGRNGSNNNNFHIYLKDCVIGGNVDYICGEFTALFDNCELQWKTYSDTAKNNGIGYITAAKTSPYIFRNCTVTTDIGTTDGVLGMYGRTWGTGSLVYFVNTETNGTIKADAWGQMSSSDSDYSFNEYKNTSNGEAFESNPEATFAGKQVTDEEVISKLTSDDVIKTYLADWTPEYYDAELASYAWGDVNHDGTVSANDAALTLQYALNPDIFTNVVSAYDVLDDVDTTVVFDKSLADVASADVPDAITAFDAACILEKSLNSDYLFEVEKDGKKPEWGTTEATTDSTTEATTEVTTTDSTTETTTQTTSNDPITVYVVGDSTGCDYINTDLNYYYKRVGFGTVLSDYLTSDATVVNLALSGRSSKSFTSEANYTKLTSSIQKGDYLLIAFGHNDEKLDDATRGTTPGGTKDTAGSFKNSIYKNYILPAQEKGATPILVTPIVRRTASGTWSDSQLHKTNGGDYAQDLVDLGAELGLTVINSTELTKNLYDELTPSETVYLHAWTNSKDSSVDNTHLNNYGAKYVAYMMAEAIKVSDSPLKSYVKAGNVAPTKADLVINPDYVEPSTDDVTGDDLISKLWTTTEQSGVKFYGSVFGDIGGAGKLQKTSTADDGSTITYDDVLAIDSATGKPYYNISEGTDGTVNLRAGALDTDGVTAITSVGKIAGTSDGIAAYYTPVDAGTNFEISGTVTVNGANANNQVAFGAIVLDTLRVDTYQAEKYTYVASSPLKLANAATETGANATYARIDGALQLGPANIKSAVTPGTTVDVSIKKVGNVYTCTYGDTTQTYTVDMTGTVYAGFYVARCADITVSNIKFNNEVVE